MPKTPRRLTFSFCHADASKSPCSSGGSASWCLTPRTVTWPVPPLTAWSHGRAKRYTDPSPFSFQWKINLSSGDRRQRFLCLTVCVRTQARIPSYEGLSLKALNALSPLKGLICLIVLYFKKLTIASATAITKDIRRETIKHLNVHLASDSSLRPISHASWRYLLVVFIAKSLL